ncbi:cellobiose-binding protein [Promicromonospora sp. AC04]|uniref:ABC transporter substrate-binding protein n=1 Tax=Promicromonospora sp. AC04 TaxID=2135723 RepID=UPI000D363053|nr:extracellular solute-binding protein [Promicromonospora sp. AC04]PUB22140.1 cellobiose-binding protein [Promicromonospora sp. AC04]
MLSSTRPTRRAAARTLQATAGAAVIVLALTACGGSGDGTTEGSGEDDGPITLKVATFNDFGYTDEMLAAYTEEHPNVTVEQVTAATSDDARTNLTTKLAAGGEGLADIEAIEVDWLPELTQYPDLFTDLADPELDGRWVDWKVAQATTTDGKVIGYGTDIGPEAICYRADLFEAAGLPTDREEVAELLGGDDATWEDYFAAGRDFVKESDAAWYDGAAGTFQGMINQLPAAFEDPESGDAKDLGDNTDVKAIYDEITGSIDDDLSAGLEQWSGDWDAGFQNDAFATMLCPAWMTGPIEERAGGVEGWDVANVFPGGGGNWGGSFLTVPASGENAEAAKELAAWLTAPEQQTSAFESAGTFPSQVDAQGSEAVQSFTNPFFNDAPVGEIFATRAQKIEGAPYKGAHYFAIRDEVTNALNRVDVTKSQDAEESWAEAVEKASALG